MSNLTPPSRQPGLFPRPRDLFPRPRELWSAQLADTPIGPVWVGVSEQGLARVVIGAPLATQCPGRAPAVLEQALRQLSEYLAGRRETFALDIDWRGLSPFNRLALEITMQIPYGQTRTYTQVADQMGHPRASRAVGGAMAGNPIPIVAPCHRVVGRDGKLHGYAAPNGIETKAFLLRLEGALAL